jgi:hypothetical protein
LLIALYIYLLTVIGKTFQIGIGSGQKNFCQFLEVPFVARVYVVLLAFGEPIDEKSPPALAKQDDRPMAAGLAFVRPRDPLLDDPPP